MKTHLPWRPAARPAWQYPQSLEIAGATVSGSDWIGVRMTEASVLKGIARVPLFGGGAGWAALVALLIHLLLPAWTWYREGR